MSGVGRVGGVELWGGEPRLTSYRWELVGSSRWAGVINVNWASLSGRCMQTWLQILEPHLNRACKTILSLILKNIFDLGADVCVYGMHMCKHMPDVWVSVHTYTLTYRGQSRTLVAFYWLPSCPDTGLSLKQKLSVLFRLTSQYLTHVMLFLCGVSVYVCLWVCMCMCVSGICSDFT